MGPRGPGFPVGPDLPIPGGPGGPDRPAVSSLRRSVMLHYVNGLFRQTMIEGFDFDLLLIIPLSTEAQISLRSSSE